MYLRNPPQNPSETTSKPFEIEPTARNPCNRSIEFVFEDLSLGTDVKQVPGLAVLNFDFVNALAVPFHLQNGTRIVPGFDGFQYNPRQLTSPNVFIRPSKYYGYNES